MNKIPAHLHDLKNKLTILYALVRKATRGQPPEPDLTDAVINRVNEILHSLNLEIGTESKRHTKIIKTSSEKLVYFIHKNAGKLESLYPEIKTRIQNDINDKIFFLFNHHLLYQIMENAVENSLHAGAKKVTFKIKKKKNMISLVINDDAKINKDRILPKYPHLGSGLFIIKENMKQMSGEARISLTKNTRVVVELLFPLIS